MLREELNNRKAAIENYKKSIEPYLKAIHKIKISQSDPEDYSGLDDPMMIEGYDTTVSGVELWCWAPISVEKTYEHKEKWGERYEKKYPFYSFIELKIKKKTRIIKAGEKEQLEIKMAAYLKTRKEIDELKEKLKEKNELMWREIEQFKGEEWKEEIPEEKGIKKLKKSVKKMMGMKEEGKSKSLEALEKSVRKIIGAPSEGEFHIPKGMKDKLEGAVYKNFILMYDLIKDLFGGLKFKRHWNE